MHATRLTRGHLIRYLPAMATGRLPESTGSFTWAEPDAYRGAIGSAALHSRGWRVHLPAA